MAAYLKHKEDGRVFVYTDLLATDPNLEPYDPEPAVAAEPVPAPVAEKPKRRKAVVEADEPVVEV